MTMAKEDFTALMGPSWYTALQPEFSKPYFTSLYNFVEQERCKETVYPPAHLVFNWTNFFPIKEVRVVIIGQDPYLRPDQANGLCFSVPEGVDPPPSLCKIYEEVANNYPGFKIPKHGNLNGWAEQGVLLLNSCLTVRAHQANSHEGQGWETFTDAVITWINDNTTGVVFMLWGVPAQQKCAHINPNKHHILKSYHPSPLAANLGYHFLGCNHFLQCNQKLNLQDRTPIDWTRGWTCLTNNQI